MRRGIPRLIAGALCLLIAAGASLPAKTIIFSGYEWTVKSGTHQGPGPNDWDERNVWVDQSGYLHLKLTKHGDRWYCAEVLTKDRLGFGRYQFWVVGRLDRLDPTVVFGLFNYPMSDVGPDGTNEIDIEFAQWGKPKALMGNLHRLAGATGASPRQQAVRCGAERRIHNAQVHLEFDRRDFPEPAWSPRRRLQPVCQLAVPAGRPAELHLPESDAR